MDNLEAYPFISEEDKQVHFDQRSLWQTYWVIDPIDGTKEFIKGNDDYCVNIALCSRTSQFMHMLLGLKQKINIMR